MTKIMLVEDDKSLREIYGVRLIAEGYEIISAGDGEAALAMAVKEHPDLIISDVMMPKISGFDMLDILRATTETKDIKVIMMTALSSEDQRARGESLGANRYLVKSQVGIEDVVRTVHEVLADTPAGAMSAASQPTPTPAPTPTPQPTVQAQPAPVVPTNDQLVTQPQNEAVLEITPQANSQSATMPAMPPIIAPTIAPMPPAPTATVVQPIPTQLVTPQPAVQAQPAPVTPQLSSTLPQPTAPFSTPAPESIRTSTINPVQPAPQPSPVDLVSREISGNTIPSQNQQIPPQI